MHRYVYVCVRAHTYIGTYTDSKLELGMLCRKPLMVLKLRMLHRGPAVLRMVIREIRFEQLSK